jgi:hypothetical protein
MSGGNGNGNGAQPSAGVEEAASQTAEWDRIVDEAVDEALAKEAKKERQKFADDIVQPLELGPQRYTDPAMWGPPEELRPVISSGPNAGKKVPLTQDSHYARIGVLLDEIESTLPLPGNG